MGQTCSCLQHRRKLERRASDESTLQDTDGDELDILIDGSSEFDVLLGGSGGRLRNSSGGGASGQGTFTKRNSKSMRVDLEDSDSLAAIGSTTTTMEAEDQLQQSGTSVRLLGSPSGSSLSVEKNLEVLRSYQKATGMVRGESATVYR